MERADIDNAMADYDKFMTEYYNECNRFNNRILKAVLNVKGKPFYNNLIKIIKETEVNEYPFKIVKKPRGEYQKENYRTIKGYWVAQWAVGMEGDSWDGTISVQLKDNKWLEMSFSI